VIESGAAGTAQHEVVDHRERQEHQRILVEHPDARLDRIARGCEVECHAVKHYLAGVRLDEARQHFHQRGLSGTVLPQQPPQLPGLDLHRDAVVGPHRAEMLVYLIQFEPAALPETVAHCLLLAREEGDQRHRQQPKEESEPEPGSPVPATTPGDPGRQVTEENRRTNDERNTEDGQPVGRGHREHRRTAPQPIARQVSECL